jgi:riboflavin kinase/FMN adenylyltransferase
MKVIYNVFNLNPDWQQSVITLGTFDGFHRGHQALLKRLSRFGKKLKLPTILVTYNPNPSLVINYKKRNREIFTLEEKISILQKYNPTYSVFMDFTKDLSKKSASWFLKEVILKKLKAKHIIIGYDHTFGKDKEGNYSFLKERQRADNFRVSRIKKVTHFGHTVSSSRIRSYLLDGDIKRANKMLKYPYFVVGTIIKGNERGRTFGFPTANLLIRKTKLLPAKGVYAGIGIFGDKKYRGMINIGYNPTFESSEGLHLEVHLLDFDKDIYGRQLKIYFLHRLRDEMKFSGIDSLVNQLNKDRQTVKKINLDNHKLYEY